jgi:putative transposase
MPLAKAIQVLKACSSKWLNDTGGGGRVFEWQQGYGAFSVSASQTRAVISYIENQASHHAKQSYEEELRRLLKRYDIVYDPKYLLG